MSTETLNQDVANWSQLVLVIYSMSPDSLKPLHSDYCYICGKRRKHINPHIFSHLSGLTFSLLNCWSLPLHLGLSRKPHPVRRDSVWRRKWCWRLHGCGGCACRFRRGGCGLRGCDATHPGRVRVPRQRGLFQPRVAARTGRPQGVSSLSRRGQQATGGLFFPSDFFLVSPESERGPENVFQSSPAKINDKIWHCRIQNK